MWLFIPSNCVPGLECSEKVFEPHSSILDSNIEPFVTWSGKPVQRANLLRLLGEPEFFKDETKQETEVNQMEVA